MVTGDRIMANAHTLIVVRKFAFVMPISINDE
jgi:hypothetical protein